MRARCWDFSIDLGKRNIFGSRRLSLKADYSFSVGDNSRMVTHRYRLRYTEPWLFGIRMPLLLTGEYEPPLKFEIQDFRIRSWSISASLISNQFFLYWLASFTNGSFSGYSFSNSPTISSYLFLKLE